MTFVWGLVSWALFAQLSSPPLPPPAMERPVNGALCADQRDFYGGARRFARFSVDRAEDVSPYRLTHLVVPLEPSEGFARFDADADRRPARPIATAAAAVVTAEWPIPCGR